MMRLVNCIANMKDFVNTLVFGAALMTGIVSLYQGVPLVALVKRVVFAMLMFYLTGVAISLMWEAASARSFSYDLSSSKSEENAGEEPAKK